MCVRERERVREREEKSVCERERERERKAIFQKNFLVEYPLRWQKKKPPMRLIQ